MSNLQATFQGIEFATGRGADDRGAVSNEYADTVDGIFRRILALGSAYSRPREGATAEELEKAKIQAPFFCRPMQGNRRKTAAAKPWPIIVLDIDGCPKTAKPQIFEVCGGLSALVYETASSTEATPHLRIVAESNHLILPEECKPVAQAFAEFFYSKIPALADWRSPEGKRAIDPCAEKPAQFFYAPYADAAEKAQIFHGAPVDVDALLQEFGLIPTAKRGKKAAKTSAPADYIPATDADLSPRILPEGFIDPALKALEDKGLIIGDGKQRGEYRILCPFECEHSIKQGDADDDTVYRAAGTGGFINGSFICQHGGCKSREQREFFQAIGINYTAYRADLEETIKTPEYFRVSGGCFTADARRVYYKKANREGGYYDARPVFDRVDVLAQARNYDGGKWGRLIRFKDMDGVTKERILLDAELNKDGGTVIESLTDAGLRLYCRGGSGAASALLSDYLYFCPCKKRVLSTDRAGWHTQKSSGRLAYVIPESDTTPIGLDESEESAEGIRYFSQSRTGADWTVRGTADEWRENVGRYVPYSRPMILAVGASFSAPLAKLLNADSMTGGFHIVGPSGCGKSTVVNVAASIYGAPKGEKEGGRVVGWQGTANSLEIQAAVHTDGVLCLDEMGATDAKNAATMAGIVKDVIYRLSQGAEKSRAQANGELRARRTWFCNLLSSGESTARQFLEKGGQEAPEGLETRLINIAAAEEGGNVFDLFADGGADADTRARADKGEVAKKALDTIYLTVQKYCGAVGRDWIRYLADNQAEVPEKAERWKKAFAEAVKRYGEVTGAQQNRARYRFELCAVGYALACEAGVMDGDARHGVDACAYLFTQWAEEHSEGNGEDRKLISRLQAACSQPMNFPPFVEYCGTYSAPEVGRPVMGFREIERRENTGAVFETGTEAADDTDRIAAFWVLTEPFKKLTGGNVHRAAKMLKARGILKAGSGRAARTQKKIGGVNQTFYVLNAAALYPSDEGK